VKSPSIHGCGDADDDRSGARLAQLEREADFTCDAICEFGISRKTGYKIFERYQEYGLEGLSDAAMDMGWAKLVGQIAQAYQK
jgi:transposase